MKILYTTDMHMRDSLPSCRTDNFFETQFKKVDEIISTIAKEKVDLWIMGGDLFDIYNPSYELLSLLQSRLEEARSKLNAPILTICGSHDMIGYNMDKLNNTAVGNLIMNGHLQLLTDKPYQIDGFNIVGISARKKLLYSDYTIDPAIASNLIIVSHDPITTDPTPYDHMLVKDVAKSTNADLILCAHIHAQFDVTENGTRFINPGPMSRQSIDEAVIVPKILIMDI